MPNWGIASEYAFASKLDDAGWTWEFLRRNAKYREDYAAAAKTHGPHSSDSSHLKLEGASETPNVRLWWDLGVKWWINGPIRDPSRNDAPLFFRGFPWQPNSNQVGWFYQSVADAAFLERDISPHEVPSEQRPEFATLVFDLRKPLPDQITRAGTLLKSRQTMLPMDVEKVPPHKGSKNWLLYLRLLDAREAGVTCSQIAKTLLKYAFDSKTAYDPVKKIEKQLASAQKLLADPLAILDWFPPIQSK
jgi:hypothetical protein